MGESAYLGRTQFEKKTSGFQAAPDALSTLHQDLGEIETDGFFWNVIALCVIPKKEKNIQKLDPKNKNQK